LHKPLAKHQGLTFVYILLRRALDILGRDVVTVA
jgi:hypothetical protein